MEKVFDLCTDWLMSLSELSEDPLFNKIPKERINYYIENSVQMGKNKAILMKKNYKDKTLLEICKGNGITVNIYDKNYKVMDTSYRAEIYYSKNQINILKPSIKVMKDELGDSFSIEEIIDIHIAHELYHFLEYKDGKDTGDLLPPVTIIKIGRFNRKSKIIKTCEIAAHAFCKEYLKLPFHPKTLDFMYLINKDELKYNKFIEYLDNISKLSLNKGS